LASYDAVVFTPQGSAPASPAANEIYYSDGDNRLYLCPDGTGTGGGARDDLRLIPKGSVPTAVRGKVYLSDGDGHPYVCTAT
jgi:hypothetical protein